MDEVKAWVASIQISVRVTGVTLADAERLAYLEQAFATMADFQMLDGPFIPVEAQSQRNYLVTFRGDTEMLPGMLRNRVYNAVQRHLRGAEA